MGVSPRRAESLLRCDFSREIEAQRDNVPGWQSIAAMARLNRCAERDGVGAAAVPPEDYALAVGALRMQGGP